MLNSPTVISGCGWLYFLTLWFHWLTYGCKICIQLTTKGNTLLNKPSLNTMLWSHKICKHHTHNSVTIVLVWRETYEFLEAKTIWQLVKVVNNYKGICLEGELILVPLWLDQLIFVFLIKHEDTTGGITWWQLWYSGSKMTL